MSLKRVKNLRSDVSTWLSANFCMEKSVLCRKYYQNFNWVRNFKFNYKKSLTNNDFKIESFNHKLQDCLLVVAQIFLTRFGEIRNFWWLWLMSMTMMIRIVLLLFPLSNLTLIDVESKKTFWLWVLLFIDWMILTKTST